ncbi:MAG: hypothetical protein GAK29_03538 [Acinetobacter bereziniae]|uniref:Uncharacterized protein n=1 Tax=Acinetobacter bereziniae TaxID=106648 RepID=A0A833PDH2_ACIBZ|nr:MAG: hypothetical protein GAK29_03538 [Acinetobacter bereziniae]
MFERRYREKDLVNYPERQAKDYINLLKYWMVLNDSNSKCW